MRDTVKAALLGLVILMCVAVSWYEWPKPQQCIVLQVEGPVRFAGF